MEKKKYYSDEDLHKANQSDFKALLVEFGFNHLHNTFFENPFRKDTKPSFSVFDSKHGIQIAKDQATGDKYTCITFLQKLKGWELYECVEFLLDFSNVFVQTEKIRERARNVNIPISEMPKLLEATKEQQDNLNYYLKVKRKISPTLCKKYVEYKQYELSNKMYYGIFFKNNSDGYAVRNPYIKLTLGTADFTTIENDDYKDWIVFEGFIDFLSAISHYQKEFKANILVLNSTSHTRKAIDYLILTLYEDSRIFTFLDNDEAGRKAQKEFDQITVLDCARVYQGYNDFNEFLTSK